MVQEAPGSGVYRLITLPLPGPSARSEQLPGPCCVQPHPPSAPSEPKQGAHSLLSCTLSSLAPTAQALPTHP